MHSPRTTGPTAAIAAIMSGIQGHGLWTGRRQLFVRFAGEAETATLYSPEMLARALERALAAGSLHSISLAGKNPAGCAPFLVQAWSAWRASVPAMLDTDGHHSDSIAAFGSILSLVQVSVTMGDPESVTERALAILSECERHSVANALVISARDPSRDAVRDASSDDAFARLVEQMHRASPGTKLVVHPPPGAERAPLDRRYSTMLERAAAIHGDVQLLMRIPAPVGVR